jgi:hypothetical protein
VLFSDSFKTTMQAIHNAIGQLQDPYFYGNDVKTSTSVQCLLLGGVHPPHGRHPHAPSPDGGRNGHQPRGREPPRRRRGLVARDLRHGARDGPGAHAVGSVRPTLQVLLLQGGHAVGHHHRVPRAQAEAGAASQPISTSGGSPLHTRVPGAPAEQIKLFADNVTYTFSQTQSDTLLHGTAAEQAAQKRVIGEIIRESIVQALEHASNHRRDMDITKAMALNCKPDHVRQAIRLKAPKGLPPLELETAHHVTGPIQGQGRRGERQQRRKSQRPQRASLQPTPRPTPTWRRRTPASARPTHVVGGPPHVVTAAGDAVAARGQTPAPTVRRVSRPSERGTTPALAGVSNVDGAPGARGSNVSSSSTNRRRSSTCRRPTNAPSTHLPPARRTTAVTTTSSSIGPPIGLASPALAQLASRATARRPWTPPTNPRTGRTSRWRRRRSSTPTPSTGPRETGMRREARRDAATSLLRGGRLSRSSPPRSTARSLPMVPQFSADLRPLRHRCQPQLHPGVHLSLAPLRGRYRQAPSSRRRPPQQRLLARHG